MVSSCPSIFVGTTMGCPIGYMCQYMATGPGCVQYHWSSISSKFVNR